MSDDETDAEQLAIDLPTPNDLAAYFVEVYKDPEVSNFERMQAGVALSNFWLGMEINRLNSFVSGFQFAQMSEMPEEPPVKMN